MTKVRLILFVLICASPAVLLTDGLVVQGIVSGIVAVALAIAARELRPGETEFFISITRLLAAVALIPAIWMLVQVLPLRLLVHPIWKSAEKALGHPVAGAISVDLGVSIIALGQYLSIAAVAFLSAAVAVDRTRADWILFGLTAAGTATALIVLAYDQFSIGVALSPLVLAQAIDCTSVGTIASGAACIRTIERYAARHSSAPRSTSSLLWTLTASILALVICGGTLMLRAPQEILAATGCGVLALSCVMIIRGFNFRTLGATALAVLSIGIAGLLLVHEPFDREKSFSLAFATGATAPTERLLGDAPLAGTGAGTFEALAQIYREMDDPPTSPVPATAAAALAIELGKPMMWLIVALTGGTILFLLSAALRRGRDSFHPAMAAGCLIALALSAFGNAGLLGTATGLLTAAAVGLGFAQGKSRTVKS
jgi:hypothetical protein